MRTTHQVQAQVEPTDDPGRGEYVTIVGVEHVATHRGIRHDSLDPGSPLAPGKPGNALKPILAGTPADLMFTKHVNSAFHGAVDLDARLTDRGIADVVLAGIQTNWCVETTARVGGNLGYHVTVALDATHTFDLHGPHGDWTADQLYRATAANLHGDGFARISSTAEVLADIDRETQRMSS
ncbi:MAG: isochorismatase family protein [Actinophytocola sp.]|nr:isochorismatase family protein [Actinophytocola sp.]